MELKKKRLKKVNIISIIINIILLIIILLASILILKNDILPVKYLIYYFLIVGFIPLIILIFLFHPKTLPKVKIVLMIVDIIYIILLSILTIYLHKTFLVLDEVSNNNYVTRNYLVLVRNNSEYQDIKELDKKRIGYVEIETANYSLAIKELNKVITFESKDYIDYTIMLEAFGLREFDGLLTTNDYYESLKEEVLNFESDYRILYKFSVQEEISYDIKKDVDVTKDSFNIYISGMDMAGRISDIVRSDVNIVVSINPKTKQVLMVNIPRDYYVLFHGQTKKDKLTHAGLYGTEMSIKTVEDLLDIDINYYFKVNFNTVTKMVDALGGVDVYSEYSFQASEGGLYFRKGFNHVNGSQALVFARIRKVLPGGDRQRGKNQQALISAIIKKVTSTDTILLRYPSLLEAMKGLFMTNMSTNKITDIFKMQISENPKWNITSISLDGSDSENYTSVFPDKKVYVMEPYEDTIKEAQEAIKKVQEGVLLESSYQENNNNDVFIPYIPKPTPNSKDEEKDKETTENPEENTNPDTEEGENDENLETNDPETNPDDETNKVPDGEDNNTENPEANPSPNPDTEEDDILNIPGLVN